MAEPHSDEFLNRFPALKRIAFGRVKRRVPVVRQLAVADCGAAALAMVLGYHGREVPLDEIRKAVGIGRSGSNAASLLRVGRAYGMRGRGVRLEVEDLEYLPPGSILFWEFRHFVVLERARAKEVDIVDPGSGRRSIPIEKFRRAFTGVALIFEPTEEFEPGSAKPKRIAGLFRQILERGDLLARIITTSILAQVLSLAMPLFTGIMIDKVVPRKDYSLLVVLTAGYCVFQLFNTISGFVRSHLFIHLRAQLEVRFTLRFLDHLVELPYSYFQQHTAGDLMVRLGTNNSVRDILTSTTLSAFLDGSMASLYLVLLLLASAPLTLMVVVLAAARFALLAFIRWRQRQFLAESIENQAKSQTYQVEMLSGMETLKAMGLEHRAAENWSNVFVDGLNISIKRGRLDAIFNVMLSVLGTVSSLALMFYGTYLVLQGTFTLGTMMAFNALASGFLGPLNSLVSSALQLQMLEVYLERLNDVMDTPAEQDRTAVTQAGPLKGEITLEKVSFRYSAQDPIVVDNVSVDVAPGARIALVGRTGSGKSTLARLLAGLYDPASGRILYDGKELRTLDRRSVRSQLGIVTQETQLFGGSIRRNIALSDPSMSLDRVIHAAKMACIHDDIMAMPMGYETPLADRGLSLSGGQRQRLAIARALASRPAILVLDEATSHLDAVTEQKLNANLASLRCTRIVIAHRLSTIRDADLILVMEKGGVIESGSHADLIVAGGAYAELLSVQREPADRAVSQLA
jgi:ABC-type bacteriocin/lantibiotic exporter with double-glycine peptidase domain